MCRPLGTQRYRFVGCPPDSVIIANVAGNSAHLEVKSTIGDTVLTKKGITVLDNVTNRLRIYFPTDLHHIHQIVLLRQLVT